MRVSGKSKVAFYVLLDIAAHTAHGRAISMPVISRRQGFSLSYLELIFATLKAADLIRSHRGPGGGYSLVPNPEEVSVMDVVKLMDDQPGARPDLGAALWDNLAMYMSTEMERITLASVLKDTHIAIETSTKGISRQAPLKLEAVIQGKAAPKAKSSKTASKKAKPRFGPNSVFNFGKYLQSI